MRDFIDWAEGVHLMKVPDPRIARTPWGTYSTPMLDMLAVVLNHHYRYRVDGGTYQFEDAATHPLPEDVRDTLRKAIHAAVRAGVPDAAKLNTAAVKDAISKIARDPRIPVGRRPRAR